MECWPIPTALGLRVLRNRGIEWADPRTGKADLVIGLTLTGKNRYPLRGMEIGEHFLVTNKGRTVKETQNAITSSVNLVQRTSDRRFTQRRYWNGVRVWRVL